jgi:hypothetical protein
MRRLLCATTLCAYVALPAVAFEHNGFSSGMSLKSATDMSNANGWDLNGPSSGTKRQTYVQAKGPGGRDGVNMVLYFCKDTSKLVALGYQVEGGARAFAEQTERYQSILGPGAFKSEGQAIGSLRSLWVTWTTPKGDKVSVHLNIGDFMDGGDKNALQTMVTLDSQECQEPAD